MLAECLAAGLGYRCIDRDTIVQRAARNGVSEEELRDAILKPPGFLERFKHKRYMYLVLFQASLVEEVRAGNAVYHGNAGHLLLRGGGPILRTRVIAPLEFRTAMAMARLKCSRGEAVSHIQRVDRERRQWTHYLYGVDWGDPALYDIVINLEHVGIQQACEVIANMARQRCFEATAGCQQWMDNLALAARVRARLALDPATSHLEFEVTAGQGRVAIRGKVAGPGELEDVRRIAGSVPGVTELDLDQLPAGGAGS